MNKENNKKFMHLYYIITINIALQVIVRKTFEIVEYYYLINKLFFLICNYTNYST